MTSLNRRSLLIGLAAFPLASKLSAAPAKYGLVPDGTDVGFTFDLSGVPQKGSMPIRSADIQVDPNRLQNSKVTVVLDVAKARTRLPFARGPMLSASVLNAQMYPTIRFVSTKVQLGPGGRISEGAKISGDLTVRGVTRPVTLNANLYRRPGTAADDLEHLSIGLTGTLNRRDFGATGYPDLVNNTVGLDIHAEIMRTR